VTRRNGALRIFLYNWPIYVVTWSAAALFPLMVWFVARRFSMIAGIAAAAAIGWSGASLLVSYYIYDRSPLVGRSWMARLAPSLDGDWASIHAGLDADVDVDGVMTGPCVGRLDIFDPTLMTAASISRARRRTARAHAPTACSPMALELVDKSCDAIVVAFTAHEIRDPHARERFFEELARALRPGGKLVLVEHLRDLANLLAFGPGFLHFLPKREWLRLASHASLTVAGEMRITPWVMALALERSP
jgi:SAM-dependent methyltransferase